MMEKDMKNNMKNGKSRRNSIIFSVFLLVIFSSIFFSGCNNGPVPLNIYTGTQGVTAKLMENNPPREVYENSDIMLMAEIWNKGAYTPGSERNKLIYVSINVDDVYLKLNDGENKNNLFKYYLHGKQEGWPIGEKTIQPIGKLHVNDIPGTRESPSTKIEVNVCYPYKTFFSETICVDKDIYTLEKNPICRNQKTYSYGGQGAPVIISRVEVDMVPVGTVQGSAQVSQPITDSEGRLVDIGHGMEPGQSIIIAPHFTIYFRNADNGVILSYSNQNPCETGPESGTVIRINGTLGTALLNCSNPEVLMYANEGSVRCSVDAQKLNSQYELNRNYELPLTIEAEYFYKATEVKNIKIVRYS
jgi:hypothetical protein